jgi:hypothetical protein
MHARRTLALFLRVLVRFVDWVRRVTMRVESSYRRRALS